MGGRQARGLIRHTKDPMVLKLSKAVNAIARDVQTPAVNLSFRIAMGIFQGLGAYGIHYAVSPNRSYAETSRNTYAIDYLQFPRQTLTYKGGDCSDLAILYSALLESLGIETAFITVPGHIYLAFAPDLYLDQCRDVFSSSDDLVVVSGKVWIPIEVTMVQDGFLKAWKEGAREWWANPDSRRFYSVRECWAAYEPVGLEGEEGLPDLSVASISDSFLRELSAFIDREVGQQETEIASEAKAGFTPALRNRLGVVYARLGLADKAGQQFEAALSDGDYEPALVNLGNLAFLRGDWQSAVAFYRRAQSLNPRDTIVLVNLARTEFELSEFEQAKALYRQAVALKPELAQTYSYLEGQTEQTTRSASAEAPEDIQWEGGET